jgi:glycogen debranching enzyme
MDEIIRIEDRCYILATSPKVSERVRILKRGESFALVDGTGDIFPAGLGEHGLYHEGTRFLSRMEFRVAGRRPFVLGSVPRNQGSIVVAHLTNPDLREGEHVVLPRETLHVARSLLLREGALHQRVEFRNFGLTPIAFDYEFGFEADFADIFEVRGTRRERRGRAREPELSADGVSLVYEGLDGVTRRARLLFSARPAELAPDRARFEAVIPPRQTAELTLRVLCEIGDRRPAALPFAEAAARTAAEDLARRGGEPQVSSTNRAFNGWLARSTGDLRMLLTPTPHGEVPYAGIPWYATPFGRDGLITALQFLWFRPEVARGVLGFLAATQADRLIAERDAEPGKILHETRKGEMAALGEIPFERYYGTVDATPLFILLAGAYEERTGDLAFIRTIWSNIERALDWIDHFGDVDGDGFVEYSPRTSRGLTNQGWKDSVDSVFHADGRLAEGPIALCEVQAYVYRARLEAARLCERMGDGDRAAELRAAAEALRERFEKAFWCEELGSYALALDGRKAPCKVRASNAGHALFGEIASPARALRVARALMNHEGFSGWGIRTVASTEIRYNPMSYHNGSIWPHDNALIALGVSRYPALPKSVVVKLFSALLDATGFSDVHGLPELFCGFRRLPEESPIRYPVACSPQAWSAGAAFMLLQAALGLSIDAPRRRVRFARPRLPEEVEELSIRDLRVGDGSIDLDLHRYPRNVGVDVVGRRGDIEVSVAE